MNMFKGYDLDNLERKCIKEVAEVSRIIGTEGIVLLKNENILPFDKTGTLSIFGRTQIDYVKSGTGSGGLVNTEYSVNIVDGFKDRININTELLNIYKEWLKENPFDIGQGWATEPWAQKEMPVTDEICARAAEISDYAMIVIGRTAGEDRDNFAKEESYLLSKEEENLIKTVVKHFEKVCVVLNTGNIIDMKWALTYNVPCILYSWQGGIEGGNSLADVVLGDVSPSGRLTDTIAYDIEDYPSTKNHGDAVKNIYEEDIYVGYRYFETFAKDKVMYPFGYGLSYTNFEYDYKAVLENDKIKISADVKNIGKYSSKDVIQIYFSAPQGKLGKPARELVAYKKTKLISSGDKDTVNIEFPVDAMSSYDDIETFAYILEAGEYTIYAGNNVRDAQSILKFTLDERVTKQLRQALAPNEEFSRIKPVSNGDGFTVGHEKAPICRFNINDRIKEHLTEQQPSTGNIGISLKDVAEGRNTMDEFILQLSDKALTCIVKGEGMNSPKVTSGTASAFGGVTTELLSFGIPPVCTTDGPSGIRMDTGEKASLIPNGTCLASTWNEEIVCEVYEYLGIELRGNEVDILLGPGTNIHRSPLNGRNFEYFSEDPLLSGKISAACTGGLHSAGVAGAIKHFACNSQEFKRARTNAVVSERALREIYLRPFEIAVKEGNVSAVMTSYNRVNGIYSPVNYDLCTSILRDEWGYNGLVMTDWWATLEITPDNKQRNLREMVKAQNDIYKVVKSSENNDDNLMESVADGSLDIFYLRKCAKNILTFILTSPALYRKPKTNISVSRDAYDEVSCVENVTSKTEFTTPSADALEIEYKTNGSEIAQYVIDVFSDGEYMTCALVQGTGDKSENVFVKLQEGKTNFKLEFASAFDFVNVKALKKK